MSAAGGSTSVLSNNNEPNNESHLDLWSEFKNLDDKPVHKSDLRVNYFGETALS